MHRYAHGADTSRILSLPRGREDPGNEVKRLSDKVFKEFFPTEATDCQHVTVFANGAYAN